MRQSRRSFVAGGLTAATLLLAAAGAGEVAEVILPDDESVAEKEDTTPAKTEEEKEEGNDAGEDKEEGVSTAATSGAAGAVGVLAAGDPLLGLPAEPAARAIRGTDEVRLRGAFWLSFPYPPPKPDTAKAPVEPRTSAKVTLHVLDLMDSAQDRHIRAGTIQLIPELWPAGSRFQNTLHVDGNGRPVRWTAVVPVVGVPSGTYRGHLVATREESAEPRRPPVMIPLVVWVKDSPLPTLAILLSGLLLLLALRAYAALRREPDEALLRLGRIEARIARDPLLHDPDGAGAPFRRKFAVYLRAAAASLEAGLAPTDADANLDRADALWVALDEGRADWEPALREEKRRIDALAAVLPPSRHIAALLQELRTGHAAAADLPAAADDGTAPAANAGAAAAATYRAAAAVRAEHVTRYYAFLDEVNAARAEAPGIQGDTPDEIKNKQRDFLLALDAVQRQWDEFATPASDDAANTKLTELRTAIATAREAAGLGGVEPAPESAAFARESVSQDAGYDPTGAELIPGRFRRRIRAARGRRRVYVGVVTALVYALLVLYGFKETWGENPEFGADRLEDYLGVLAWALGMNLATVIGLSAFMGQWSIPWLSGTTPDGAAAPDMDANQPSPEPDADTDPDADTGLATEAAATGDRRARIPGRQRR